MKKIFGQLSSILTTKDKKFASYLLVFSIVISVIEMLGVAIIMPFISVASDFSTIDENAYYSIVYSYFNFRTHIDFVVSFGVVLVVFYIFRGVINLYYIYFLERFSLGRHHLIVCRLFENYMGMSYRNFIDRNSSEFTKAIVMEAWNLTNIFKALLFMVSEVFIIIFIYLIMLYMSYKATLVLTFFLTLNFFFLTRVVSKKIKTIGIKREKVQRNFFEIINSTLGNFKLIKLHSHDVDILNKFKSVSYKFSKINIVNSTLGNFPKVFLEAVGFSSIVFSIIFIVWKYQVDITSSLPLISMFVLGLYRLMPSVNRIMNGYNSILFNLQSLNIVRNDLLYYVEDYGDKKINFNNEIILQNIGFDYDQKTKILKGVNLTINQGDKIAFIGESGSGKSTLVDIIIGLYRPKEGDILVDGQLIDDSNIKDFRKKVGYIPQSIYLFDGTVAQNVASGFPYDEYKIKDVLKQANILEFLEKKQGGILTRVGEGGIKLSGGQKQRIAIARALYGNPEILVLDEATSALDSKTEIEIMNEIYGASKNRTLIIIAHRLSTLEKCERIFEIKDCKLKEI